MRVDLLRDELIRVRLEALPQEEAKWDSETETTVGRPTLSRSSQPPQGSCRMCAEKEATQVCVQCERSFCLGHYWVLLGLCRECLTEDEWKAARERSTEFSRPRLDIKWIED